MTYIPIQPNFTTGLVWLSGSVYGTPDSTAANFGAETDVNASPNQNGITSTSEMMETVNALNIGTQPPIK